MDEQQLLGFVLGALEPDEERAVEAYLAEHPESQAVVARLRRAVAPLGLDADDNAELPADLALRTIGCVAEHIVTSEGTVAQAGDSSVSDYLQAVGAKRPPAPLPPVYPHQAALDGPPTYRFRNIVAMFSLTTAAVLIGLAAVMSFRQMEEMKACQNNMRLMSQAINAYCDLNDGKCPRVPPNTNVREAWRDVHPFLPREFTWTCAATGNTDVAFTPDEKPVPSPALIEYAYCLGYHDEFGRLQGVTRDADNDHYPILADAPLRRSGATVPVNHRKGQNVLYLGGHVRFCTDPYVGPNRDDIFYNTVHEVQAGTHRWDSVLGRANERP
jgi:hypothetical protein